MVQRLVKQEGCIVWQTSHKSHQKSKVQENNLVHVFEDMKNSSVLSKNTFNKNEYGLRTPNESIFQKSQIFWPSGIGVWF